MKFLRALAFLFFLAFGSTIFFLQMAGSNGELRATEIQVTRGMSVQDVAKTLKEHGIITSTIAFRWYVKSKELDTGIKTGIFTIPQGATYAEIAAILASAEGQEISVTIPEGYTVTQIDALLAEKLLIKSGELLACAKGESATSFDELRINEVGCDFSSFEFLPADVPAGGHGGRPEGYLFPDTYFVNPEEFVSKFFLERMLSNFSARVIGGLKDDIASSGRSLEDIVTMAALIERETRTDEERPVVSGILWKRFDAERGLDVDATVRYALQKPVDPLTKDDLENMSPYNTRRHAGLPPGPIANPGLKSIQAALHPAESRYWYYLHGSDGVIRYAETNEEHNANKARYL